MPSPFDPTSASSPFVAQKPGMVQGVLDALAVPREAVAGAVRAIGAGENLFTGAQQGIDEKLSFGDLLKDRGATDAGAAVGGFVLDAVVDPVNFIPLGAAFGLLRQGAKAIGKIPFVINEIPTFAGVAAKFETLGKMSAVVQDAVDIQMERGTLRALAQQLKKDNTLLPTPGEGLLSSLAATAPKSAARREAHRRIIADRLQRGLFSNDEQTVKAASAVLELAELKGSKTALSPQQVNVLMRRVARVEDKEFRKWATDGNHSVANEVRRFTSKWLRNTEESLKRDEGFRAVGTPMARLFGMASELHDQFRAASDQYFVRLMHGMSKGARLAADAMIRGEELGRYAKYADDPKVLALRDAWVKHAEDIFDTGRKLNLYEVNPIGGVDGPAMFPIRSHRMYAPEYRDPTAVRKWVQTPSAARDEMVAMIKKTGKGELKTEKEVQNALWGLLTHDHVNWARDIRAPGLQFARLGSPVGFERDPAFWIHRYTGLSGKRLAFAKFFGGRDNVYEGFKNTLAKTGGDVERLDEIFNLALGRADKEYAATTALMRNAVVVSMLDLGTTFIQATQFIPNVSTFGFKNALKGALTETFDSPTKHLVKRGAALLPSATGEFLPDLASKWVGIIRLKASDKGMRGFAGAASIFHAQDIGERLVKLVGKGVTSGKEYDKLIRAAHFLDLDPAELIAKGGAVSEGQILQAIRAGANKTQHASEFLDLPEKSATTAGRWAFMLRKFGMQQAKWMDRHVMAEFKKGNLAPITRLLIAAPAAGGLIGYGIDFVRGKERDVNIQSIVESGLNGNITKEEVGEYLAMSSVIGLLGIWGDMIANAPSTPDKLASFVLGPGFSLVGEGYSAAKAATIDGDIEKAQKILTRRIPGVGRLIVNHAE